MTWSDSRDSRPPDGDDSGVVVTRDGAVVTLWLSRAERLNAVDETMLDAAASAVDAASTDDTVRAIGISGIGRAFSSGADVTPRDALDARDPGSVTVEMLDALGRLILAITTSRKPVVAIVKGPAVGVGASIAFAADLPFATESAYFSLAFVKLALVPDGAATLTVPKSVGLARAMRLALLGERIPATLAAEWGLLAGAFPDDEFDERVAEVFATLSAGPAGAHSAIKKLLRSSVADVREVLQAERAAQLERVTSDDFIEGINAFRQKRLPHFSKD